MSEKNVQVSQFRVDRQYFDACMRACALEDIPKPVARNVGVNLVIFNVPTSKLPAILNRLRTVRAVVEQLPAVSAAA